MSLTIEHPELNDWALTANYEFGKGYYMPSLKNSVDDDWDNGKWIYETLMPFLQRYAIGQLTRADELTDMYQMFNDHSAKCLLQILNRSILLGWDKC